MMTLNEIRKLRALNAVVTISPKGVTIRARKESA